MDSQQYEIPLDLATGRKAVVTMPVPILESDVRALRKWCQWIELLEQGEKLGLQTSITESAEG